MTPIISRRHKINFYASIIFWSVFFLAAGALMILKVPTTKPGGLTGEIGVLIACIPFLLVYRYYKNAPVIKIDGKYISFNEASFLLENIQHIKFAKHNFLGFLYYPREAMEIHFKNSQMRLMYDDMYENSWELKLYLQQVVIDKKEFNIEKSFAVQPAEVERGHYDAYKGHPLATFHGILFWCVMGVFIFLGSLRPAIPIIIVAISGASLIFYIQSGHMYYFMVSDRFLVIKNYHFLWKKDAFRLSNIREVVIEKDNRKPICLRVITNDFKYKVYAADTLRVKTWLALKERFERNRIKVRNEFLLTRMEA